MARNHTKAYHNYHRKQIKAWLGGESVEESVLWLAVGYFYDGAGRQYLDKERPFSEDGWRRLLEATDRSLDDPYFKNQPSAECRHPTVEGAETGRFCTDCREPVDN